LQFHAIIHTQKVNYVAINLKEVLKPSKATHKYK